MGLASKSWIKLWLILLVIIVFVLFRKFSKKTVEGFITTTATISEFYTFGDAAYTFNGMCADSAGNLYATHQIRHIIVKFDTSGNLSTFAGISFTTGHADGSGTSASFNTPYDIKIDSSDNLYVADYGNNKIRKITPSGVVSTYAGTGALGTADGLTALTSTFNGPIYIAIDSSNNLYVNQSIWNSKLRVIKANGTCSSLTISGVVLNSNTLFSILAFDSTNNLYISNKSFIIKVDTVTLTYSTLAGSTIATFLDGVGTNAKFNSIYSMIIDKSTNIMYVGDADSHRVRKIILSSSTVSTLAGNGTSGQDYRTPIQSWDCINWPGALAINSSGDLFISDYSTNDHSNIIKKIKIVTTCGLGEYVSGTSCLKCQPGTYNATNNTTATSCTPCAYGSYTSSSGQLQCSQCPAGSYCPSSSTNSTQCSPGTYQPISGQASCLQCLSGEYSGAGSTSCSKCSMTGANGYSSPANASSPASCTVTSCSPGYTLNNGTCTACGAGTSSAGGTATSCTSCGVGTYSLSTASNCTSCGAGKYTTGTGSTAAASCLPLPAGAIQNPAGGYSCSSGYYNSNNTCTILPTGATINSSGNGFTCASGYSQSVTGCTQCLAGTYAAAGATTCSACGTGTYSSSNGATSCTPAPSNTIVNANKTGFTCSTGFYNSNGSCTPLPTGATINSSGTGFTCAPNYYNNGTTCIPLPSNATINSTGTGFTCAAGFSQSATGCTQCAAGTYNSSAGAISCLPCGSNTYSSAGATVCLSPPPNAIANSSGTGFACSTGFYNNNGTCTALPSNATLNTAGTSFICAAGFSQSATGCTQCGIGYYSGSPGASSCTACGANQYTTSNGATSCLTLPSNAVLNSSGTGYACSSNYYNSNGVCLSPPLNASVNSDGTGYTCGPGFYGTGTACSSLPSNATANSSGTGFTCQAGFSQSSTACTQCYAGYYSSAGSSNCTACSSGTYSSAGATVCLSPPPNSIVSSDRKGFICNSNYYNGGTSCISLPSNASINSNGTGFVCGTGYMQGLTSCASCGVGTYNSVPGSSNCSSCSLSDGASAMTSPQGSGAQSNCTATSCQPGYGFSSGNCTQCGAGFFGSGGTTTCVACSQTGYTSPAGSSNSNACYCPNTNLPPRSQGSVSNTLAALNTCVPNGTNIYNYTIGTSVTTTNPCSGQSFYDFDQKACVNSLGAVVDSGSTTVCDNNSVYSQETNACVPVRTIIKQDDPQLTGTTGTPGPGDYNNCKSADQGDCTLLFKGLDGSYTTTNPCLANGTKYNFATKACSTVGNPCCAFTTPLAAAYGGCVNDTEHVYSKNASKCPTGSKDICCNPSSSTNSSCKAKGYWTDTLKFKASHTTACAITSAFSDYGDNNKIDTIAEKRTKRLIRIRA